MKMDRRYFTIILGIAVLCFFFIIFSLLRPDNQPPTQELSFVHPQSPFKSYISGLGIVESSSENILIGTPVNRIIDKVLVKVGTKVKSGEVLFRLEDRDMEADLFSKEVEYESSLARLMKLRSLPRPEDIAPAEASLKIADVELSQAKNQYEMVQGLQDLGAVSQEEQNRRRYNFQEAEAKKQLANADLEKIKAGTWKPDLEIARLEVMSAKASVERVKSDIQRTIIRSPIDGTVLQVKIHEGEYPPQDTPVMILGNIDQLNLKVGINQYDASFFEPTARAVAFLQGDARKEYNLEFVQIQPFLVSKQYLSNDVSEKVDTKVLQVLYKITNADEKVFVGQQMDVFIQADYKAKK
jgi:multidrug resistance efflux pump